MKLQLACHSSLVHEEDPFLMTAAVATGADPKHGEGCLDQSGDVGAMMTFLIDVDAGEPGAAR